ncbi:MAG: acyl carrier protein [Lachnospiraceae bacterium]|nr:acyl carrier protein [Lachnospiraceae bacterium]
MIFERLVNIFERIMPQVNTSEIKMESILTSDLGVDSLNMLLLAISVEEEFGIRFEQDAKLETVKDICDYVELKAVA